MVSGYIYIVGGGTVGGGTGSGSGSGFPGWDLTKNKGI
jgi:hypothetical protein